MTYKTRELACGINVGDKVIVLRKAKSYEDGWAYPWIPSMDETVKNIYTVKHISPGRFGIGLGNAHGTEECGNSHHPADSYWYYPFFVLQKVEDAKPPIKKIKVNICGQIIELPELIYNHIKGDL